MRIGPQRHADSTMPRDFLHHFGRYTHTEQNRCCTVRRSCKRIVASLLPQATYEIAQGEIQGEKSYHAYRDLPKRKKLRKNEVMVLYLNSHSISSTLW